MNSDYAPTTTKTGHVGQKRDFTIIPWEQWHRRYAPASMRCLVYKDVEGKMTDIRDKTFNYTDALHDSATAVIISGQRMIILSWELDYRIGISRHDKANTYLNQTIPIDPSQQFHDGIVAMGVGRWMKSLFMTIIAASRADRPRLFEWFRECVRFVHELSLMPSSDVWFDVIRETIKTNDHVEDILIIKLLQAVLRIGTTRLREFRWFELSIQRSFKFQKELKDNLLMPLVWLYVHELLVRNTRDTVALDMVFDMMEKLSSYDDKTIIQTLIDRIFPELTEYADGIMEAARNKTSWMPDIAISMTDGSIIPAVVQDLPLGMCVSAGTLTRSAAASTLNMTMNEYNYYTPLMMCRPLAGQEVHLEIFGQAIPADMTSRHGSGMVLRGLTDFTKNNKVFMGIMGLSLAGGRGDGRGPPTNERPRPSCLSAHTGIHLIATVHITHHHYTMTTTGWSSPLSMEFRSSDAIFAVFIKGFRDVRIEYAIDETPDNGVSFSDMIGDETPLMRLQSRVR